MVHILVASDAAAFLTRLIAVLEPSAMPGARVHRLYEAGDPCELVLPPMSSLIRILDKLQFRLQDAAERILEQAFS